MTPEFIGLGQERVVGNDEAIQTVTQVKLDGACEVFGVVITRSAAEAASETCDTRFRFGSEARC